MTATRTFALLLVDSKVSMQGSSPVPNAEGSDDLAP